MKLFVLCFVGALTALVSVTDANLAADLSKMKAAIDAEKLGDKAITDKMNAEMGAALAKIPDPTLRTQKEQEMKNQIAQKEADLKAQLDKKKKDLSDDIEKRSKAARDESIAAGTRLPDKKGGMPPSKEMIAKEKEIKAKATEISKDLVAKVKELQKNGGGDEDMKKRKRATRYKVDSNGFFLKSASKASNTFFSAEMRTKKKAFELRYFTRSSEDGTGEDKTRYRVRFHRLVQFVDTNPLIEGFDDEDTVCKTWLLDGTNAVVTDLGTTTNSDGTSIGRAKASLNGGLLDVTVSFSGKPETAADSTQESGILPFVATDRIIDVTTVKFDLDIVIANGGGYNSTCFAAAAASSKLALINYVKTKTATGITQTLADGRTVLDATAPSVETSAVKFGADGGFFTWKNTITLDGKADRVASVIASPMTPGSDADDTGTDASDTSKLAAWTFDTVQPASLSWDPEVGQGSTSPTAGSTGIASSPASMIAPLSAITLAATLLGAGVTLLVL